MDDSRPPPSPYFLLIREAGVIAQIGSAFIERRLPPGLLISHFSVLTHLMRVRDGETPLKLARAFQVPKNTMTHTLAGLSERALVELRPNPADKRSKQVWITEAGRGLILQTLQALGPVTKALEDRFDPDRLAALLPDLAAFRAVIDTLRDEMDQDPPASG